MATIMRRFLWNFFSSSTWEKNSDNDTIFEDLEKKISSRFLLMLLSKVKKFLFWKFKLIIKRNSLRSALYSIFSEPYLPKVCFKFPNFNTQKSWHPCTQKIPRSITPLPNRKIKISTLQLFIMNTSANDVSRKRGNQGFLRIHKKKSQGVIYDPKSRFYKLFRINQTQSLSTHGSCPPPLHPAR